jgi:CDP-glucose 4,6-dehydratase
VVNSEHPITMNLEPSWPYLLGFNEVSLRSEAELLATIDDYPLLAAGVFGKGRSVCLTGHTGFKGSWLSLLLSSLGADVTGYALDSPTQPNLFEQARVADDVHSIQGDIRDFQRLRGALNDSRATVVIHMAAQSVVSRGYDDPIETYSSNVMGTVNLLEAVRQVARPCAVVNVTSDKCY